MLKPQGNRGEVAAELLTQYPERFAQRRRLFALEASGTRRELQLQDFWTHKRRMILKFAGVDSISDAEKLAGCELQIPRSERAELEAGSAWVSDLVGCIVLAGGRELGRVQTLDFTAGEAPLLIVGEDAGAGKRYEIPWVESYIEQCDLPGKRIVMSLPEGMLELDAPLTDEEKRSIVPGEGKKKNKGKKIE